ncbi:MAG: protein phosphatase 2C domain-containing protein [Ilumatobacteraceae bacterium]
MSRDTMILDLDDDDTTPTDNVDVMAELAAALGATRLTVVDWGAATSQGMRRRVNEDAWGSRGELFVVADGMGGRGGGALAARTAVDRILARASTPPATTDWRSVVTAVNDDVVQAGVARGIERLGTTLLAAAVGGPLVTLVHLGDSRAYRLTRAPDRAAPARLDAGQLDLLTHDHNVRSELLAAGLDVREYRDRGVALHGLTSFIGLEHETLRIDVLAVPVRAGDRLLLCTDGVHRQLDDDQIRRELAAETSHQAAERLVERSDRAGGRDNATALVLHLDVTPGDDRDHR